jgi:hypothetical protein
MNDRMNVFITESNVEIFLAKAYNSMDANERAMLLRLVADEHGRMGGRGEHLENGQRRLNDCRERLRRQREAISASDPRAPELTSEKFRLETLEKVLLMLEEHQRILGERYESGR